MDSWRGHTLYGSAIFFFLKYLANTYRKQSAEVCSKLLRKVVAPTVDPVFRVSDVTSVKAHVGLL